MRSPQRSHWINHWFGKLSRSGKKSHWWIHMRNQWYLSHNKDQQSNIWPLQVGLIKNHCWSHRKTVDSGAPSISYKAALPLIAGTTKYHLSNYRLMGIQCRTLFVSLCFRHFMYLFELLFHHKTQIVEILRVDVSRSIFSLNTSCILFVNSMTLFSILMYLFLQLLNPLLREIFSHHHVFWLI